MWTTLAGASPFSRSASAFDALQRLARRFGAEQGAAGASRCARPAAAFDRQQPARRFGAATGGSKENQQCMLPGGSNTQAAAAAQRAQGASAASGVMQRAHVQSAKVQSQWSRAAARTNVQQSECLAVIGLVQIEPLMAKCSILLHASMPVYKSPCGGAECGRAASTACLQHGAAPRMLTYDACVGNAMPAFVHVGMECCS